MEFIVFLNIAIYIFLLVFMGIPYTANKHIKFYKSMNIRIINRHAYFKGFIVIITVDMRLRNPSNNTVY